MNPLTPTRASATLSILVTTLLGTAGALLYLNLAHYNLSRDAVERAAVAAARCLSTSDSECTRVEAAPPLTTWRWTRRVDHSMPDIFVRRFNYSAEMRQADYRISYTTYDIPKVYEPPVQWTTYAVPLRRYVSEPARRYGHHVRTVSEIIDRGYQPKYTERFPVFLRTAIEEGSDAEPDLSIESWKRRLAEIGGFDVSLFGSWGSGSEPRRINDREVGRFESSDILIPELEPSMVRGCVQGAICGVAEAAGCDDCRNRRSEVEQFGCAQACATARRAPAAFVDWAFLAIKAFAEVKKLRGDPRLSWEDASGNGDNGLELLVTIPAEVASRLRIGQERSNQAVRWRIPLGGRDWKSVDRRDYQWRNLVLRGPAGANGGSVFHQHIAIPRGASFRIAGRLHIEDGDVAARVTFLHYFDDYRKVIETREAAYQCPWIEVPSAHDAQALCPDNARCGIPQTAQIAVSTCRLVETRFACSRTFAPLGISDPPTTIERFEAACDGAARFTLAAEKDAAPGDGCGLVEDKAFTQIVDVGGLTGACPAGKPLPHQRLCGESRAVITAPCDGNHGTISERCPWIGQEIAASRDRLDALQQAGHLGPSNSFSSLSTASFRWGEAENAPSVASWAPYDEAQRAVSCARRREHSATIRSFVRADGSLPITSEQVAAALQSAAGKPTAEALSAVRIEKVPGSTRAIPARGVFPFERKPEREIALWLPRAPRDLTSCAAGAATPSLEQRLRTYASWILPEALDSSLDFRWSAEPVDTELVQAGSRCTERELAFESCVLWQTRPSGRICSTAEVPILGYTASEPPPICHEAGARCTKEIEDLVSLSAPLSPITDSHRAEEIGAAALRRLLPGARPGCSDPGCVRFAIIADNGAEASVRVTYDMPLLFPLRTILGRPALPISFEKRERKELLMVGG